MSGEPASILTLNGGSSSIRLAVFGGERFSRRLWSGRIERIGLPDSSFTVKGAGERTGFTRSVSAPCHTDAIHLILDWILEGRDSLNLRAVAHRVVHGGPKYSAARRIDSEMIRTLRELTPFDPQHLPQEIELIETCQQRFPDLPQIACFDTDFHRGMPRVAQLLPIPRQYFREGVRRYGFHGLSYRFLLEELARSGGSDAARGRVILAHLGNGASLAAVRNGEPIDTSMGFTPAAGVPMSTRSGDLDPGLVGYFAQTARMDPRGFNEMVNSRSGLLGISETSSDIRDLLERAPTDERAADAVEMFCYGVKKTIGAFAAALGGLDRLVFSAGIGENAPEIRRRVCEGLEFFGIRLDDRRNRTGEAIISADGSRVAVHVIRTDEELMMAKIVGEILEPRENA